jgi:cytochrome oxidase Cu insertion factor (SCO1/SenC/PrrC family)
MELAAVAATGAAIVFAVQAYRQKRLRFVATTSALLASLLTAMFLLVVHVGSHELPGAPKEIAIGMDAPDFTLPDARGSDFSLASTRGSPVLLVFYRGVW